MVGFVSFVVMFSLLVFVHELGHFVVAKLARVRVDEFGFGYPPRLARLGEWRGTVISINALPFGGFVRMHEDDPSAEGSLASKGRTIRALVYVSGALMNLVLAMVLYSAVYMLGTPMPVDRPGAGIYVVSPGSPAEIAGFRPGDNIVSINGVEVQDVQQAIGLIRDNLGQSTEFAIERDGQVLPAMSVTPRLDPPPNEGALGVALDLPLEKRYHPVWQAVPLGVRSTFYVVGGIFEGIRAAIRRQLPFQVTGIVGIYTMTTEVARTGLAQLLQFAAYLSTNLFLLNLLPLPALDGGRLVFVLLEWIRGGRRVPPEKEGIVHAIGMALLIGLMLVVTFFDVMRFYG
jgi:regulator of sigma E protease